jgi:hypothetical protein
MLRIRIHKRRRQETQVKKREEMGGRGMCEYMTGGRLNKRIDVGNCKKREEMNSRALVLL